MYNNIVRFELASSFYLILIKQVAAGIPYLPLMLVSSVQNVNELKVFIHKLNSKRMIKLKEILFGKNSILGDVGDRLSILKRADSCKINGQYRHAVKLYGILLITAYELDDEFKWSFYHLSDIAKNIYEIQLKCNDFKNIVELN